MKMLPIPRRWFDLRKLVKAVRTFTQVMDGHEPFPIVQGGVAIYDADFCDMLDAGLVEEPMRRWMNSFKRKGKT